MIQTYLDNQVVFDRGGYDPHFEHCEGTYTCAPDHLARDIRKADEFDCPITVDTFMLFYFLGDAQSQGSYFAECNTKVREVMRSNVLPTASRHRLERWWEHG